jgi:hypothetical protein
MTLNNIYFIYVIPRLGDGVAMMCAELPVHGKRSNNKSFPDLTGESRP